MTVTEITNRVHGCRKTELCLVKVPAYLSHTGYTCWRWKPVDKCLASLVNALNAKADTAPGQLTASCCCGHGVVDGQIICHDDTRIPTGFCKLENR